MSYEFLVTGKLSQERLIYVDEVPVVDVSLVWTLSVAETFMCESLIRAKDISQCHLVVGPILRVDLYISCARVSI